MLPGDIVLIQFPRTDLEQGKLRPALVLAITPDKFRDRLITMISSQINRAVPDVDEVVQRGDKDFKQVGLKTNSVTRITRIATVQPNIIRGKLGSISDKRLSRVKARISSWILRNDR